MTVRSLSVRRAVTPGMIIEAGAHAVPLMEQRVRRELIESGAVPESVVLVWYCEGVAVANNMLDDGAS